MTIVENSDGKFYIPDKIANDHNKTVKELKENAIPFELWEAQENVKTIQAELDRLNALPDEILVPNEEKSKIHNTEARLLAAQTTLDNLIGKYENLS